MSAEHTHYDPRVDLCGDVCWVGMVRVIAMKLVPAFKSMQIDPITEDMTTRCTLISTTPPTSLSGTIRRR